MQKHTALKMIIMIFMTTFISCIPASIHAYQGPIMEPSMLATIQTNNEINNFGIQEIDGKWPPLHQSQGFLNGGIIKKQIYITPGYHVIRISLTINHYISNLTLSSNIGLNAESGKEYVIQIRSDQLVKSAFLWIEEKNSRKLVVPPIPVIPKKLSSVKN